MADTAGRAGAARVDLVLFDLDGTLVDSAPDLAGTANELRAADGLAPLPYERLRPWVGSGARGMIGAALGIKPGEPRFDQLREWFLTRYAQRLLQETTVFAEMAPVLSALDAAPMRWGIVTNKVASLARPLCEGLGLHERAVVLIGGDTTPFAKPHPEPLLEAARRAGAQPSRCVYVGDDERDVAAGRAAGMATLAAAWGYLGEGRPVDAWGADDVLARPQELLQWLQMP